MLHSPTQETTNSYICKITKLFKDTNLKIAFKTPSTIDKLLNEKQETNSYGQSGIYKITCQSCYKIYIGQTGRHLTRYKEHIRNIRLNKDESTFDQHILNKGHQYGPMTKIIGMVEHAKKCNLLNIKENFYVCHCNKIYKLIEEQKIYKRGR
jgi:hypothetical protein